MGNRGVDKILSILHEHGKIVTDGAAPVRREKEHAGGLAAEVKTNLGRFDAEAKLQTPGMEQFPGPFPG
jgi:hypothetical protein